MNIKNYNSALHLSDYTTGAAYAFYIRNYDISRLEKATPEMVRKYGSVINEIAKKQEYSGATGRWLVFTKALGVVVDKHCNGMMDFLTVMFRTIDGDYVLSNYAVGFPNVFTNNHDALCPAAILGL